MSHLIGTSPTFENRRGRLFFRDDMENYTTIKWQAGVGALTYVNAPSTSWEGNFVLQCLNAGGPNFQFSKLLPSLPRGKVSFEGFSNCQANPIYIEHIIRDYDGTYRYDARINFHRYDPIGFFYTNIGGVEVPIPTTKLPIISFAPWNYVKMTVDLATHKYMSVATSITGLDGVEVVDFMQKSLDNTYAHTSVEVQGQFSANNIAFWFDDARIYVYE